MGPLNVHENQIKDEVFKQSYKTHHFGNTQRSRDLNRSTPVLDFFFAQQKVSPTERLTDRRTDGAPEQQERRTQQVLRERHCSRSHHSPAVHMHTAAQGWINTNGRARAEGVTRVRRDRRTVLGTCPCLHLRARVCVCLCRNTPRAFSGFTAPLSGQLRCCTQRLSTSVGPWLYIFK